MRNWSYKITEGEHAGETLWSGRYCCVAGFIFSHTNNYNVKVLAVKRGQDCPDFRGMWCCPCGFLEADENSKEGIVRETYEETGYNFSTEYFDLFAVETDPKLCNKSHVTLMHACVINQHEVDDYLDKDWQQTDKESEEIQWIPVDEISKYKWAFGHDKIINGIMETL
jgi:ADP-ribose pyrophosphatase YjhB (NUDIX family)